MSNSESPEQAEDNSASSANHRSGYVAIVGPTNAGKSTLLNQLLGQKVSIVSPKVQTTRTRVLGIKSSNNAQLIFLDTPGFVARQFRNTLGSYLEQELKNSVSGVDVLLLVLDASRLAHYPEESDALVADLKDRGLSAPAVVVLNKIDLLDKLRLLPLIEGLVSHFPKNKSIEFVPVSATKRDGLDVLEKILIERIPLGPCFYPDGVVTDQSDQFLASEIIREKLFFFLGQELPYSMAVSIEGWKEDEKLLSINAVINVERTSQKPMVVGKGGAKIKEISTSARKELERLFGIKVFLKVFVRVEPNWTKSEKGLKKVGYSAQG